METAFCSELSRSIHEDPIGTATPIETYILLEASRPWTSNAWESPQIPVALQEAITKIKKKFPKTRTLLIHQEETKNRTQRSLMIYQRPNLELVHRFDRYEFELDQPEDAIAILEDFFAGRFTVNPSTQSTQDLLICTHGSHDRCCARHGNPFYLEARRLVQSLPQEIRVWRSSHFGGHRFAPTAITFPDGRLYARLEAFSLKSILTRTGSIEHLANLYRGSSLVPAELQGMERSIWLKLGWDWMDMAFKTIAETDSTSEKQRIYSTFEFQQSEQERMVCQAQVILDEEKSITLPPSCGVEKTSTYHHYQITPLEFTRVPYEVSVRDRA